MQRPHNLLLVIDKGVPFRELRISLEELEKLERQYDGKVKEKLNEAINLGFKTTDAYYEACNKIYSWSLRASRTTEYVLSREIFLNVNDTANITSNITRQRIGAISTSLLSLQEVQQQLTEVATALETIPSDLEEELEESQLERFMTILNVRTGIKFMINDIVALVLSVVSGPVLFYNQGTRLIFI